MTVLLPLEPVIAITGALALRANNSMSPKISAPRTRASAINGSRNEMPGLTIKHVARLKASELKPPTNTAISGYASCNSSYAGGCSRLSVTATSIPRSLK